ncbi:MAG: hypothetical protein ACOCPU_02450 [Methanohalophilus sp.]
MEELLKLKDKLEKMTSAELYEYVKENYPENPDAGLGKKKLVIRRILNLEREKMNKCE